MMRLGCRLRQDFSGRGRLTTILVKSNSVKILDNQKTFNETSLNIFTITRSNLFKSTDLMKKINSNIPYIQSFTTYSGLNAGYSTCLNAIFGQRGLLSAFLGRKIVVNNARNEHSHTPFSPHFCQTHHFLTLIDRV